MHVKLRECSLTALVTIDNTDPDPHLVDESIEHLDRGVGGGGVVQPVPGESSQVAELVRKPRHLASSDVR